VVALVTTITSIATRNAASAPAATRRFTSYIFADLTAPYEAIRARARAARTSAESVSMS
jgi:hypothetical protein